MTAPKDEKKPQDWQKDKILKVLRMYPLGRTRDQLRRVFGYASASALTETLRALIAEGKAYMTPPGFGQQKIILIRKPPCPECMGTGEVSYYDTYHKAENVAQCDTCEGRNDD